MMTTLITLLIAALVLYLIWFAVGLFISGKPHTVVGIFLAIIFLLYALKAFNLVALPG